MHGPLWIGHVFEGIGEKERPHLGRPEGKVVNVFQSIYAGTGLHIASNIGFAREERAQIADLFLSRNLESADLHD
jgi:hypothetical protein